MKAAIFTIGNEVLTGKTLNTNSHYLAGALAAYGFEVVKHLTVEDDPETIITHTRQLMEEVDLIITTGGLGPTYDDLTIASLAKACDVPLAFHQEIMDDIAEKFRHYGSPMSENNRQQAYLIEGAEVLPNEFGTAPGMYYDHGQVILVALPGPPRENIPMFEKEVKPRLMALGNGEVHIRDLVIVGMGESHVETTMQTHLDPDPLVRIATYVKPRYVIIRLTSRDETATQAQIERLQALFGDKVLGEGEITLESWLVEAMTRHGLSLALAESLTGGMIASHIVNVPGSSKVLDRAYITYSNTAKCEDLGVSERTLESTGAVSEETALEMVKGLSERTHAQICLAVTGIAGPGGGTEAKPVGRTYIALKHGEHESVKEFTFFGDRETIRHRTTLTALNMIRLEMLSEGLDR